MLSPTAPATAVAQLTRCPLGPAQKWRQLPTANTGREKADEKRGGKKMKKRERGGKKKEEKGEEKEKKGKREKEEDCYTNRLGLGNDIK